MLRKEARSDSGMEDVIQCITLSPIDISTDLGKCSSETVLRTQLAWWIILWLQVQPQAWLRCAQMCLDEPSSLSCLTQTGWEVKWGKKIPLKDVFAERQREREQLSAPAGCRSSFEDVSPDLPTFPLKTEAERGKTS